MEEAIAAGSKLNPVNSSHIYPSGLNERSEQINRGKKGDWDRKMIDLNENIADLNAAGMTMGVLQPTQTTFFYWTETSAASELSRMVNEFTAKEVRRRPDQMGTEAEPQPAGYETGERIRNDFLLQSPGGWLMKNHMFFI